MIRLGVTGGMGSGKSTICELLSILDIPVYIADIESKKITESSPIIKYKLIEFFGKSLYDGDKLNKKKFANIIFNDKSMLEKANSIIHPEVDKHYLEWCRSNTDKPITALESAILFESNMVRLTDCTLLVYAPYEERIERTMKRDNTTRDIVVARMNNQIPDENKLEKVNYVIYNNEKLSIINQVTQLMTKLYVKKNG